MITRCAPTRFPARFRSSAGTWTSLWGECAPEPRPFYLFIVHELKVFFSLSASQNPHGWDLTVWRHVHRTLLHLQCKSKLIFSVPRKFFPILGNENEGYIPGSVTSSSMCLCRHLQAIWENQFYYLFGFLFLVFIILVVSCSQISIVMVYFQLCAEVRPPRHRSVAVVTWRFVPHGERWCAVSVFLTIRTTGGGGERSWCQEALLSTSWFTPSSTLPIR